MALIGIVPALNIAEAWAMPFDITIEILEARAAMIRQPEAPRESSGPMPVTRNADGSITRRVRSMDDLSAFLQGGVV